MHRKQWKEQNGPVSTATSPYRTSGAEVVRSLAWLGMLALVAWGGATLGRGALAPPPLAEPGAWADWAAARSPVEAGFAVLTLVVVVLAWYLLAVTVLATTGHLLRARRLLRLADVLTLPLLRPAVHAALGLGLVGATVAGVAAAPGARPGVRPLDPAAAALVVATGEPSRVPPGPRAEGFAAPVADGEASRPVMRLLPPEDAGSIETDDPASRPVMRLLPPEAASSPEPAPDPDALVAAEPAPAPAVDARWEVRPGDHLWSVAAHVLEEAWGAPATDDEVAPYWRRLVEANRSVLADPANPDLLFPSQLLAVPAPPPAPR